jgi:hypothetical protein
MLRCRIRANTCFSLFFVVLSLGPKLKVSATRRNEKTPKLDHAVIKYAANTKSHNCQINAHFCHAWAIGARIFVGNCIICLYCTVGCAIKKGRGKKNLFFVCHVPLRLSLD